VASIGKVNRINAYSDGNALSREHEFGIAARYSVLYALLTGACEQRDQAGREAEYIAMHPVRSERT
jgi:hypothetical protein